MVLVTGDRDTENAVFTALSQDDRFTLLQVFHDIPSVVTYLEQTPVAFVVVDIDPQPLRALSDLETAANRFVASRFIALTQEFRQDVMLRGMQAGIRHIQLKSTIASELTGELHRLHPGAVSQTGRRGRVVTVLSSGGGCGATTVAVNLANELQLLSNEPTLIIDLDYSYGAVAAYLEIDAQYGIAEVLSHASGVDGQLILSTVARHSERLHALISPASIDINRVPTLLADQLENTLHACQQSYRFTVIDAPRVSIDVAATLAEASHLILVIMQPMVKDIRVVKAILDGLIERGIPVDRIRAVMNRCRKRYQMIDPQEAKEVLDNVQLSQISNDYPSATRCINYGKTLADAAPRSPLRRDLVVLANEIAGVEQSKK